MEELADHRAGPRVQPVAVDPQVELDPAGLESELQRGVQGSEVQLLFVYLVSSERAGELLLFNRRDKNAKTAPPNTLSGLPVHPPRA